MSDSQSGEWWAMISHAFDVHVREESYFLDEYEALCKEVLDPGARFLIELILEDERRHHRLFEKMSASAREGDQAGPEGTPDPPDLDADQARRILEPTRRFLEAELEDRRHLRELRKKLEPVRDDTIWHLMVELMELDTSKHVKILEYLSAQLGQSARKG